MSTAKAYSGNSSESISPPSVHSVQRDGLPAMDDQTVVSTCPSRAARGLDSPYQRARAGRSDQQSPDPPVVVRSDNLRSGARIAQRNLTLSGGLGEPDRRGLAYTLVPTPVRTRCCRCSEQIVIRRVKAAPPLHNLDRVGVIGSPTHRGTVAPPLTQSFIHIGPSSMQGLTRGSSSLLVSPARSPRCQQLRFEF
jgi:hypothetical protein